MHCKSKFHLSRHAELYSFCPWRYNPYFCRMNHCCCSITKLCLTLCNPMDCSTPGFPGLHHLPEFAQIHVHWVGDAISPSHPLPPSSPFTCNLSKHYGLFQWVSSLHCVVKGLELQRQSFQRIFRINFLQDWLVWFPCCPRDSQDSFQYNSKASIFWHSAFFMVQLSHP